MVNLFVIMGGITIPSLLIGLGETKMMMKQSLLSLILGIPLAFLLIPTFSILGAILASLLSGIPSRFWILYWVWKHYKVKINFKSSARIFTASAIAAITTYLSLNFLPSAELTRLITGGMIFLGVYIFATPMIGAIDQTDINNLRAMFSGLGIISKLMEVPLLIMAKINGKLQQASSSSDNVEERSKLHL